MYEYPYAAMPDIESSLAGIGMAMVGGFLAIFLIFYIAILAFALACYIFRSLGWYTIAKRRGIHTPWLAWIPMGNLWILGSISDQYQYVAMNRVKKRRNILPGLSAAMLILSLPIGIISGVTAATGTLNSSAMLSGLVLVLTIFVLAVLSIVSAVFYYMALYDLYRSCAKSDGTLYLILSILFPVAEPFMVFACRNKDEGMPPRRTVSQPEAVQVFVVDEQVNDETVQASVVDEQVDDETVQVSAADEQAEEETVTEEDFVEI